MTPYDKLRSIVFTITTAIMFFAWSLITTLSNSNMYINAILGAIVSLGTYRIILKLMETIIIKLTFIKELVFGNSFLEGIWVGAYIGTDNKPRYYIEYFEQNFDGLIIRVFCYNDEYSFKGTWISDQVFINEKSGTITYTYITDMIHYTSKNQGLAVFNFCRNTKNKRPQKMIGFSSDIYSSQKFKSYEWKLTKDQKKWDTKELIKLAESYYEKECTGCDYL